MVRCAQCGLDIPGGDAQPRSPCPNCGSVARRIDESIEETIQVGDSYQYEHLTEYYKKNKKILAAVIVIALVSPFLGLVLAGPAGIIVGLVLGGVSYALGPRAAIKVRQITRGGT